MKTRKILITSDVFLVGGLETHIRDYSEELIENGAEVFLATGSKYNPLLQPEGLLGVNNDLICNYSMSFADLEQDVLLLNKIIKEHQINHIHAHPFISPIAALIAAKQNNISISLYMGFIM